MASMDDAFVSPRLTPWPRDIGLHLRVVAFCGAVAELLWLDGLGLLGYRALRRTVARRRVASRRVSYEALNLVRVAVRDACIVYPKPVHCLQRSAVVTRMLRRRGVAAELVIGCQTRPAESHAWVEIDGKVVWDRIPAIAYYGVIDRI